MMRNKALLDYFFILMTVVLTVYGQLILKWRVGFYGQSPLENIERLKFIIKIIMDPWIISGLSAAFLASLAWIITLSKFDLTVAYPFTSLNFVFILFLGGFIFNEHLSAAKVLGIGLIMLGTIIATRS